MMVRQGDILVVEIGGPLPRGATSVTREGGSVVLAHGEATTHRHRIASSRAALYDYGGERLLVIDRTVELVHEEHAAIRLPPGLYRVVRQREYVPNAPAREVAD